MVKIFLTFFFLLNFLSCLFGFQPTQTEEAIDIGGIKQWISIKTTDSKNPVLLFLHGGPGNSAMSYANKFTSELQRHFIVVQWDQRESGKTAKLNSSPEPLTVSLMESDAVEVINYLRKRFSCKKVYLVGHSWGGFLGLKLAADHPELIEAYFAVSPMVHQTESERLSIEWLKAKATENKNAVELKELANVAIPFKTWEDLYYHRKWLAITMGTKPASRDFVEIWAKKQLSLFLEASKFNFFTEVSEIKCPVYFLVGKRDYQTYFKLTEDFYKMVKAEKKDLFWFTDSAHNPNLTEPAKFQEIIISVLKSKH
jgi:pimeloyl-ACP methyl ester carboxylesterase